MPGASVDLNGTFNFRDRTVHLLGNLHMQSDISNVTTGFKSLLMKPLILFFQKGQFRRSYPNRHHRLSPPIQGHPKSSPSQIAGSVVIRITQILRLRTQSNRYKPEVKSSLPSAGIAASRGSTTENVVPLRAPSRFDRTRMEPPFLSTSCLHTHRPRPVPTIPFVVKKGSKISFIVAAPMPCPESATVIRTRRLPSLGSTEAEARRTTLLSRATACRLFRSRFAKTCRSSPKTPIACSSSSHCCSTVAPLDLIFACSRATTEVIKAVTELLVAAEDS
jgi:hypothetical protein